MSSASSAPLAIMPVRPSTVVSFFSTLAMLLAVVLIRGILFAYQWATGTALTGPLSLTPIHYVWLLAFSLLVGTMADGFLKQ